jgi:deoxyhypusine synthase
MVVTGSGPNIHEGITILISELMDKNIVNSVSTSSAVIAHEMAGSLDKVKRVPAHKLGIEIDKDILPRGDIFEFTQLKEEDLEKLQKELILDEELLKKSKSVDGDIIIKAAGNMAYPMGLRTEILSREILNIAQTYNLPFEEVAGWGADERTMIGKGAEKGFPVIVTVPQLVGGGAVGLSIGDSISISERSMRIARMLEESEVIIESAVALTQEIHDGPFECYTGHGIWSHWIGMNTFSLKEKTIIRIDLDKQLIQAKLMENENKKIQEAINKGLPKTKITGIPFRMEMSAFARHEKSIPIVGDIGKIWPIIASKVADGLGISLDFISYPQESEEGKSMREWIVENVKPVDRRKLLERSKRYKL